MLHISSCSRHQWHFSLKQYANPIHSICTKKKDQKAIIADLMHHFEKLSEIFRLVVFTDLQSCNPMQKDLQRRRTKTGQRDATERKKGRVGALNHRADRSLTLQITIFCCLAYMALISQHCRPTARLEKDGNCSCTSILILILEILKL